MLWRTMLIAAGVQNTDRDMRILARGAVSLHQKASMQPSVRYEANCAAVSMDRLWPRAEIPSRRR